MRLRRVRCILCGSIDSIKSDRVLEYLRIVLFVIFFVFKSSFFFWSEYIDGVEVFVFLSNKGSLVKKIVIFSKIVIVGEKFGIFDNFFRCEVLKKG